MNFISEFKSSGVDLFFRGVVVAERSRWKEDECTNVKARGLEPPCGIYIYIRTGGKIEISMEHDESIGVVDERDQSTMKRERRDATFQKISTTPVPRLSPRVAFYQDILQEEVKRERERKRARGRRKNDSRPRDEWVVDPR